MSLIPTIHRIRIYIYMNIYIYGDMHVLNLFTLRLSTDRSRHVVSMIVESSWKELAAAAAKTYDPDVMHDIQECVMGVDQEHTLV